jgi:hypothetical protein
LVLEAIAGPAETFAKPGIERVSRTLERELVNASVDRPKEATRS